MTPGTRHFGSMALLENRGDMISIPCYIQPYGTTFPEICQASAPANWKCCELVSCPPITLSEADGGASSIGYDTGTYTAGKVTGIALVAATAAAGGATGEALADSKTGGYFGRGTGTRLNGRLGEAFIRFGWGWSQKIGASGSDVIRLGIGAARGTSWWSHINFWVVR